MDKPTCATCPFWHRDRSECRVNAPIRAPNPCNLTPQFPFTKDADWCGEHPEFATWLKRPASQRNCDPEKLKLPIEKIALDKHTQKFGIIKELGIETVGDLIKFTSRELSNCRGVRKHTISNIEKALAKLGLCLRNHGE